MSSPIQSEKNQGNQDDHTAPVEGIRDRDNLLHEVVSAMDREPDPLFSMRGHSLNPLLDAAQSLFGLVIALRNTETGNADKLYRKVRDQITTIGEEIRLAGYDTTTQLTYRYALCAFIDEAVLSTAWGGGSSWRDRSLPSYHHNETWGGEKFFTVLERMQMDPARYQEVLEFKYMCLCLGFQGKYGAQPDTQEVLNGLIVKLHRILRQLRGPAPERLFDEPEHAVSRGYRLPRLWPLWTPWALAAMVMTGVYLYLSNRLEHSTEQVLRSLDFILQL